MVLLRSRRGTTTRISSWFRTPPTMDRTPVDVADLPVLQTDGYEFQSVPGGPDRLLYTYSYRRPGHSQGAAEQSVPIGAAVGDQLPHHELPGEAVRQYPHSPGVCPRHQQGPDYSKR